MDNITLINQKLQDHIQYDVEHFADSISTPQTYFFLSMLFLQSVGFMEQKISCIVWEMGYREHLNRYNVLKDYGMESVEFSKLNKLYKKLNNQINNKKFNLPLEIAPNILEGIKQIIQYSSSLSEELEYNFFVLENDIPKKIERLNEDNKMTENLIEELKGQRNFIAHFKSFYPDKSIISFCAEDKDKNNKNIRFEYFLLYLAVLIKLDEMFIEAFKSYEND